MRGPVSGREAMWTDIAPDARVPADHPIRLIQPQADAALQALDRTFDEMDRPSMLPERLLKAQLLIARSSVRSDRLCCERLDSDSLFRWFLDMNLEEPRWDHSPVSANRDRLLAQEVGRRFFDAVVNQARRGIHPRTLGADKGAHGRAFVRWLRRQRIRPHLARVTSRHTPGLDGRTTRPAGYVLSQRLRKRVEEIIGWINTTGGLRKTRFGGVARTPLAGDLVGAADTLLRLSRLLRPQPAG